MLILASIASIAFYFACFSMLLRSTLGQSSLDKKFSNLFIALFVAATASHALSLHFNLFAQGKLNLSFTHASSLIFFSISMICLSGIVRKLPIDNLVLLYIPFSSLSVFLAWLLPGDELKSISGHGLISHIVLSILAYSFITIAALQASLMAVQEHHLRSKRFDGIFKYLPPLQTMETLLFEMIWLGFITLTIAIASGFTFLHDMFAQHLAHKTILSIIAWAVFAILLFGRHKWGWRGNTATKWTLVGFSALMLAYFGSKFVLEILLSESWTQ